MSTPVPSPVPRAILFDLDGTLADTAPDLAAAVNLLRSARGLETTPYEVLRPTASAGARGMIGASFGLTPQDAGFDELKTGFFNNYEAAIAVHTTLFDGVPELLDGLQQAGLAWGIVTNKPSRFTDPLLPLIGLAHAGCIISGDTTPHAKPHPEPLLEAARRLGLAPEQCWYVGDDLRDIQAGQAAGMATVACAWGYCGATEPAGWSADHLLASPHELLTLLRSRVGGSELAA
jgi:phosphoglycolate phosphatase